MAWSVFSTTGSFLEDFATLLAMARSIISTPSSSLSSSSDPMMAIAGGT